VAAVPDKAALDAGVSTTRAAARKRAAAPSWATIRGKFDKLGGVATLNAKGETVGYKYPRSADPEKQRKINQTVYEMWNPKRKVEMEVGAEVSAETSKKMVKIKQGDGTVREVIPDKAEKIDRICSSGRIRSVWTRKYSEAPYWRNRKRA
jgi:hypothetical protein